MKEEKKEEGKDRLTIKNSDIDRIEATRISGRENAFDHLCSCRDLPVELSFPLKELKHLMAPIFQRFNQQSMELIEKHGDRDEDNKLISPAPNAFRFSKHLKEFQMDRDKFLRLESKIDFEKLIINLKEDIPDRYLSTNDQEALECLVEFKMREGK